MTKPKAMPSRSRAGRPGYDELGLYVEFMAIRQLSGLSANKLASCLSLALASANVSSREWPIITGETLRRYIVRVAQNLKSGFKQMTPATTRVIDGMIVRHMDAMSDEDRALLKRLGEEKRSVLSQDRARG